MIMNVDNGNEDEDRWLRRLLRISYKDKMGRCKCRTGKSRTEKNEKNDGQQHRMNAV